MSGSEGYAKRRHDVCCCGCAVWCFGLLLDFACKNDVFDDALCFCLLGGPCG